MRKPVLLLVCLGSAISFASLGMTRQLVVLLADKEGASPMLIGLIVALYALVPLLSALHIGILTDVYGARPILITGSLAFFAAMLVVAVIPTIPGLILSQLVAGLAQLAIVLSCQTYVSSVGEGRAMESNFSLYSTFVSVGQLAGPLFGGFLADRVSYQAAFCGSAILSIFVVVTGLFLPSASKSVSPKKAVKIEANSIRKLLLHRSMRAGMLSSFAVLFAHGARQAFFPLYLDNIGFTATTIGVFESTRAAAAMLIKPFLPKIVEVCHGRFNALPIAISFAALGLLIIPAGTSFGFFIFVSTVVGIGTGLCQPLSMIIVADDSPQEERGLAMGLRLMGNRLAQLTNPVMFGAIASAAGLVAAFVAGGSLLLATALIMLSFRNQLIVTERKAGGRVEG